MENTYKLNLNVGENENINEITSTLVLEYINLLLFFRGQIPSPVQMLKRQINGGLGLKMDKKNVRNKQGGNNRKCQLCLSQLDALKKNVQKVLNYCDAFEAVLLMGATPVSVKEVYTIKVQAPTGFTRGVGSQTTTPKLQRHTNRMNALLFEASSSFKKELRCTKSTLLVKARRKLATESFKPWENFKYLAKRHVMHLDVNLRAPSDNDFRHLLPATRGLHVNTTCRAKRRSFSATEAAELVVRAEDGSRDDVKPRRRSLPASLPQHDDSDVTQSDDVLWFEVPVSIRGFKF